jgi:hypothetical protein
MAAAFIASATPTQPANLAFEELPLGTPSGYYAGLAMADVNQDGYAELLAGRREEAEGLHLFTYSESKWTQHIITRQGHYGGVALADLTGDKIPDIVAVKNQANKTGLELFQSALASGGMQFQPLPSPLTGTPCDDVAVGDIDSDGDLDIAVSTGGKGVKVLLNQGKGLSFRSLTLETDTYEDTGIALGDVNMDGRLDVITSNHPGKNPRLFLCSNAGEVSYSAAHTKGLSINPCIGYRIAIADLNLDGFNEAVVGTEQGLRIFLGNGCRGPEATWWRPLNPLDRGRNTLQVSVGDLNQDDKLDLAFSSDSGIFILLNRGAAGFSQRTTSGLPTKGEYAGCCLHDWDGDGDLDLACSSFQGENLRFFRNDFIK